MWLLRNKLIDNKSISNIKYRISLPSGTTWYWVKFSIFTNLKYKKTSTQHILWNGSRFLCIASFTYELKNQFCGTNQEKILFQNEIPVNLYIHSADYIPISRFHRFVAQQQFIYINANVSADHTLNRCSNINIEVFFFRWIKETKITIN